MTLCGGAAAAGGSDAVLKVATATAVMGKTRLIVEQRFRTLNAPRSRRACRTRDGIPVTPLKATAHERLRPESVVHTDCHNLDTDQGGRVRSRRATIGRPSVHLRNPGSGGPVHEARE